MRKFIASIVTLVLLLLITDVFVSRLTSSEFEQANYRIPQPNGTSPYFLSPYVRFIQKHGEADSLLFFGDSTVWSGSLGRKDTLYAQTAKKTNKTIYNLSIPGMGLDDLSILMEYTLSRTKSKTVIMPFQYFWGASSAAYPNLKSILDEQKVPWDLYRYRYIIGQRLFGLMPKEKIEDRYKHLRYNVPLGEFEDYEETSIKEHSYRTTDENTLKSIKEYHGSIFVPKKVDEQTLNSYRKIKSITEKYNDRTFYFYFPPYLLSEAEAISNLSKAEYDEYVASIFEVFKDSNNVRLEDFNSLSNWETDELFDWVHLSYKGATRFSSYLSSWLMEDLKV
ncbi:hypothetical protein [Cohnella boryungensis]|uniref:SGNH/GDSL hydrolase family protein n=1 Tax=Cohnella boryungensis TaxID=768479 RepID=A0ABV8SFS7_9BACL